MLSGVEASESQVSYLQFKFPVSGLRFPDSRSVLLQYVNCVIYVSNYVTYRAFIQPNFAITESNTLYHGKVFKKSAGKDRGGHA